MCDFLLPFGLKWGMSLRDVKSYFFGFPSPDNLLPLKSMVGKFFNLEWPGLRCEFDKHKNLCCVELNLRSVTLNDFHEYNSS